jgi:hypothetical protein
MLVLLLVSLSSISGIYAIAGLLSALDAVMFLLSLLLLASLYTVIGFTVFASIPCFWWRPYCVGGPVVAYIPAVVSGHDIDVILNAACWWRCCCCLCHWCSLNLDCSKHSCCCWRPLSSWGFPVAGLSAIADVPGVTNSALAFLLYLSNMLLLAVLLILAFLLLRAFLMLQASLLILLVALHTRL